MHPFDVGRSITAVRASSAVAVLAAAALAAAVPPRADAASYRVWACASGSGIPLSKGDWVRGTSAPLADVFDTCGSPATPTGSFVANALATSAFADGGGGWRLEAAPGTRISALDLWWSWSVLPSRASGMIRVAALGNHFPAATPGLDFDGNGPCCGDSAFVSRVPGSFGATTENDPKIAFAESNHQSFPNLQGPDGPGTPVAAVIAACVNFCGSPRDVVAAFRAYRIKTTVEDATPPTGTSAGLVNGMRVGSVVPVQSTGADVGGGVREVTLRVDGQVVQRVGGGDGCADLDPSNADVLEYNLMKPCPSALAAPLALAPSQFPDNEAHTVTTVATDAAGQETILSAARAALAAPAGSHDARGFYNPDLNILAARQLNGARADATAKLTLRFVRRSRLAKRRTVRYGIRPRIVGRVRTANHKAVAGARVWRAAQSPDGRWRISGRPLVSSRSGIVSARLPARRPSREIRLVYFPFTDTNANAQSVGRVLRVRTATTINSDQGGYRNGDTLKFTGRIIRNRLIASKTVFLQAIVRGKWRTFKTTRADKSGRWRLAHRFEATKRPTIYTFRAVVPAQTGYPWATGYSRRVRVLVTP